MEALPELTSLVANALLSLIGIYLVIVIARVYSLYRSLGFPRTVLTPYLLVGVMFAFAGVTELLEVFAGELGLVAHSSVMLTTGVLLLFALRSYHKMLMNAEEGKEASKLSFSKS